MLPETISASAEGPVSAEMPETGGSVPDYFQEEGEAALRSRVDWLERRVGVNDSFFAKFLRTEESSLRDWRVISDI